MKRPKLNKTPKMLWRSLALVLVCLLVAAEGKRHKRYSCKRSRNQAYNVVPTENVACSSPRDTLLRLPVPQGYEWIYPYVVMAKSCRGQMCHQRNQECAAATRENKTVKVQAYKFDKTNSKCLVVPYQEDTSCACMCDKKPEDCGGMEVFNKRTCQCECNSRAEQQCRTWMAERPNMYMWSQATCSCPCNKGNQMCDSGTYWIPKMCRCARMMMHEEEPMVLGSGGQVQ